MNLPDNKTANDEEILMAAGKLGACRLQNIAIRDYIAIQAMQGLLAADADTLAPQHLAIAAVSFADALLLELAK